MRDSDRLRAYLHHAIAGVSIATLANACDSTPEPKAEAVVEPQSPPSLEVSAKAAPATKKPEQGGTKPNISPAKPKVPQVPGYLLGDPPYVEGYNPEEIACPRGDWCGPLETTNRLMISNDKRDDATSCPVRISGRNLDTTAKDPAYKDLGSSKMMQGVLKEWRTQKVREKKGRSDDCCYHWFEYCSGRALVSEGEAKVADVRVAKATSDWAARTQATFELDLPEATREYLASRWQLNALQEHASVASFARATLELMALGAPANLIVETQQAGIDEVLHTQACFGLSLYFGGAPVEPGALDVPAPRKPDLQRLAVDVFLEACIGETVATLRATRQLRDCSDPRVQEVLTMIITDEAKHAALGWSTLAWAIEQGGASVWAAVQLAAIEWANSVGDRMSFPLTGSGDTPLARAGYLTSEQESVVKFDAWHDIIEPTLASLAPIT